MRIKYDIVINYYIDTNIIKTINSIKGSYLNANYIDWYDNGKQHLQYDCVNGDLNGEYNEWRKNGKLHIHCYYIDNKLDEEYTSYFEDGSIYEDLIYDNGEIIKEIK